MTFLTPFFLVGLAAVAVPILIHLIQREKRRVVLFPSLMFVRRIPYQSVRRRRIRNWVLLMLRAAALALIVLAFARPFLRQRELAAAAASGAREVVVLLDTSYSMGYGDHWDRARKAARDALSGLAPRDRASVVLFALEPEVALRSTGDRGRLLAAVEAAKPSAGATRYGPALKLAGSILSESPLTRREAVLISDFQMTGWKGAEGVRLPDGARLTTVSLAAGDKQDTPNVAVMPVSLQRSKFSNQERVAVTATVKNRGRQPVGGLDVALEIGGRVIQTQRVNLEPYGSGSVTFAPFTVDARNMRGTVRVAADPLAADNAFHFVVSPAQPVRIVVVQRGGDGSAANLCGIL